MEFNYKSGFDLGMWLWLFVYLIMFNDVLFVV